MLRLFDEPRYRLGELFEIGDRVTILRDGQKIDTKPISDITMDELIAKIALGAAAAALPALAAKLIRRNRKKGAEPDAG